MRRSGYGAAALLLGCTLSLAGCSAGLAGDNKSEICGAVEALQASLQNLSAATGELATDVTYAVARAQDLRTTVDNASEAQSRKMEAALEMFLAEASPSVLAAAGPAYTLPTSTSIPLPSPTATGDAPTSGELAQVKEAAGTLEESVEAELDRVGC